MVTNEKLFKGDHSYTFKPDQVLWKNEMGKAGLSSSSIAFSSIPYISVDYVKPYYQALDADIG